jgi:leucyl-tRNA synthetase
MSKSKYNAINPEQGHRMPMALMSSGCMKCSSVHWNRPSHGIPRESKEWRSSSNGSGAQFFDDQFANWILTDEAPSEEALKVLHKTIKKVSEDIEKLALNTCISAFHDRIE